MELAKLDSEASLDDEELKRQIAHEEEMYLKAKESRELLEQKMKKLEEERQQLLDRIGSGEVPEIQLPTTQKSAVGEEVEIATAQRIVVEASKPKAQENMSKPVVDADQGKKEEAEKEEKKDEEEDEGIIGKVVSFVSSYFSWE